MYDDCYDDTTDRIRRKACLYVCVSGLQHVHHYHHRQRTTDNNQHTQSAYTPPHQADSCTRLHTHPQPPIHSRDHEYSKIYITRHERTAAGWVSSQSPRRLFPTTGLCTTTVSNNNREITHSRTPATKVPIRGGLALLLHPDGVRARLYATEATSDNHHQLSDLTSRNSHNKPLCMRTSQQQHAITHNSSNKDNLLEPVHLRRDRRRWQPPYPFPPFLLR